MKMNKVLSLLLALVLALGCLTPAASAATSGTVLDTEATAPSTEGPLTLGNTNLAEDVETVEPSSGTAELELFSDRFVESAERFSEQVNRTPADDEVVNFIVVLDQDSLLAAGFTTDEITGRSLATSLYQVGQNVSLTNLKATLSSVLSDAQTLKLGYTYTIATTGVSVTTEYGNKAVLESLPGVKSVYVAPTFALPETESQNSGVAAPMTDNATTMISRRLEALKRFGCEGTIYHVNRSCKVMDCQMMEVQRQLSKAAGVPFTSFDGDQADPRNFSEAQYDTRVQGLVEIMDANKAAKGAM